jgi:hypothetical protein
MPMHLENACYRLPARESKDGAKGIQGPAAAQPGKRGLWGC